MKIEKERDTGKEKGAKKTKKRVKYVKVYNSTSMCSTKRNGHVSVVVQYLGGSGGLTNQRRIERDVNGPGRTPCVNSKAPWNPGPKVGNCWTFFGPKVTLFGTTWGHPETLLGPFETESGTPHGKRKICPCYFKKHFFASLSSYVIFVGWYVTHTEMCVLYKIQNNRFQNYKKKSF